MGRLQEREATREFMKHGKVRSLEAFPRKKIGFLLSMWLVLE